MQVVIVVDAAVALSHRDDLQSATGSDRLSAALQQAILADVAGASTTSSFSTFNCFSPEISRSVGVPNIQVVSVSQLQAESWLDICATDAAPLHSLLCPLTLQLPETLAFPGQAVYGQCRDIFRLRQVVTQQFGVAVGDGFWWLPIVLTAKGPLYGEVIGLNTPFQSEGAVTDFSLLPYYQPLHLPDHWRQSLYRLGRSLLQLLEAPAATYLMQFGFDESHIYFDRLWPFPAAPAIASINVQTPNLFTCHWRCLTGQPILDLQIAATAEYQVFGSAI